MQMVFLRRFVAAALLYAAVFGLLAALHDYPQLRHHLHKTRSGDEIAVKRQWLSLFYLVNEAGSGIKFYLTGNERHMWHYPSASHILAARTARAKSGEWEAQLQLAFMYARGEFVSQDLRESLAWLTIARDNAPSQADARKIEEWIAIVTGRLEKSGAQTPKATDEGAREPAAPR